MLGNAGFLGVGPQGLGFVHRLHRQVVYSSIPAMVKATMDALLRLKAPQKVARLRGRSIEEIVGTPEAEEKSAPAPAAGSAEA